MIVSLVFVHILSGALGLLAGFSILFSAKGSPSHKLVGRAFFCSMMILGLTGAIIGFARWIPLSALNGLLICYFVLTSLLVIRRRGPNTRRYEWLLALVGSILIVAYVVFGFEARGMPDGKLGGFPGMIYFVFAGITAVAVVGDGRYLRVSSPSGRGWVVRHLWRMFFPFFMAAAAFFLGQAKLFPPAIQQSASIFLPVVIVVGAMLFWSVQVGFATAWGRGKFSG